MFCQLRFSKIRQIVALRKVIHFKITFCRNSGKAILERVLEKVYDNNTKYSMKKAGKFMKNNFTEIRNYKRWITAMLALLIAFSAVITVPQPAEAASLPKVTGVKAVSSTYKSIKITWKKISKVTGYKVYRATSANGKYKLVKTISSAKTTAYMDTKGVRTGTKYYYKVRAYEISGKKFTYGSYSNTVSAKAVPSKVKLKKVTNTAYGEVTLSWEKVDGATGYEIYRLSDDETNYKKIKTITKGNIITFANKKLEYDMWYSYKLRAFKTIKGKKVYGNFSRKISIITLEDGEDNGPWES